MWTTMVQQAFATPRRGPRERSAARAAMLDEVSGGVHSLLGSSQFYRVDSRRYAMRTGLVAAILITCLCGSGPAFAGPAYKADDVIKTFTSPTLGKARSVCVGDETECPAKAQDQPSFDLLVTFDFNSDHLTSSARENLDQFALALKDPRLATQRFAIDGHTDATGSENYNLGLSERRAKAVVGYLEARGIDATKLVPRGYGKTKPRVADPFDAVNRRVETRLEQ